MKMRKVNFSDQDDDIVFFDIYGMLQSWNKSSMFSYLSTQRPNHGFMYLLCDKIIFEFPDGGRKEYIRGDIIYIPNGLRYKVSFEDKNDSFNTLLINFSTDKEIVFYESTALVVSSASSKYTDEFYNIISSYKMMKNSYYSIMTSFFSLLDNISKHIRKKEFSKGKYESIEPALTYIDFHLNDKLYISQLAKMCLMSESSFRKYFREYIGEPPNEYILNQKLEKAKRMLKSPDIPVHAVADELGFYDCAYFYKLFMKKYGITPVTFRNKYTE